MSLDFEEPALGSIIPYVTETTDKKLAQVWFAWHLLPVPELATVMSGAPQQGYTTSYCHCILKTKSSKHGSLKDILCSKDNRQTVTVSYLFLDDIKLIFHGAEWTELMIPSQTHLPRLQYLNTSLSAMDGTSTLEINGGNTALDPTQHLLLQQQTFPQQ
ncbi:hypothetical protein STEG23_013941, partial [Scotinomys teguina]